MKFVGSEKCDSGGYLQTVMFPYPQGSYGEPNLLADQFFEVAVQKAFIFSTKVGRFKAQLRIYH
jgi:hypothetical protein